MGSRKGKPNNVTAKTRDILRSLTDKTAPELEKWLIEVYEQEGPNEAIKRYLDFAEFVMPKLARLEHTGEDGEPIQQQTEIKINLVRPSN
jgi:hypothetical protein